MDKYEIRRQRLIQLMHDKCGGKTTEIAKKIERSDSYVSRMMYPEGKSGKKRIGEDMADLITQSFELPAYWLDGDMAPIDASPQAREVAKAFDSLDSALQNHLIGVLEGFGAKVRRVPREPALTIGKRTQDSASPEDADNNHRKQQSSGSSSSE